MSRRSWGRALDRRQVRRRDDTDRRTFPGGVDPPGIGLLERAAGHVLHEVEAKWRVSHPRDIHALKGEDGTQRRRGSAKRTKRHFHTAEVVARRAEPEVHILREPRRPVEAKR